MVSRSIAPRKIALNHKTNPNHNPNWGAIVLEGNCPDTCRMSAIQIYEKQIPSQEEEHVSMYVFHRYIIGFAVTTKNDGFVLKMSSVNVNNYAAVYEFCCI